MTVTYLTLAVDEESMEKKRLVVAGMLQGGMLASQAKLKQYDLLLLSWIDYYYGEGMDRLWIDYG